MYIYELQDEQGKITQGFLAVATTMQKFYKTLLGEQDNQRRHIDPHIINMGSTLIAEQQLAMCAPFTEKDIKTTIFSIPNTKLPGPDDFSSGFFKTTWHLTGGLVNDAI